MEQSLYSKIRVILTNAGLDVYDTPTAPPEASYPFACFGEGGNSLTFGKNFQRGQVTETIHIWSNKPRLRGDFSRLMTKITCGIRQIDQAGGHIVIVQEINTRTILDDSTGSMLLHGVIEPTFRVI